MRTIIAGSRSLSSFDLRNCIREYKLRITEIVCGCAPGIDIAGFDWARENRVPVRFFPAWVNQHTYAFFKKKTGEVIDYPSGGYGAGKGNGFRRNIRMAGYADSLLAIHDGKSGGTAHMIKEAEKAGLVVTVFTLVDGEFKRRQLQ